MSDVHWTPEQGEHYRQEMHRHAEEKAEVLAKLKRVFEECDRYGLPHSVDALLRHIYNNHAATLAFKDMSIETLTGQRDRLRTTLETAKWKLIEVRSQAGTALDAIAKAEHDLNDAS